MHYRIAPTTFAVVQQAPSGQRGESKWRYTVQGSTETSIVLAFPAAPDALTCSGFFEPIIPGGWLGWGWVDVAA